jgi:hypothetical protein
VTRRESLEKPVVEQLLVRRNPIAERNVILRVLRKEVQALVQSALRPVDNVPGDHPSLNVAEAEVVHALPECEPGVVLERRRDRQVEDARSEHHARIDRLPVVVHASRQREESAYQ